MILLLSARRELTPALSQLGNLALEILATAADGGRDGAARRATLRTSLAALGVLASHLAEQEAQLSAAEKVFGVHSQAGSAMAGAKAKFLQPEDLPLLHECVRALEGRAGVAAVEGAGKNILLAGSIGAA